nr:SIR2 family protein [uncultured Pseudomonas sp.]
MPRKLVIFGNGLGMATDPIHFNLTNAIRDVWGMPNVLNEHQKALICRCTGQQDQHPAGEEDLGILHQAVAACKVLNDIGPNDIHWLSPEGQEFPEAISKFIHKIATRLHNYDGPTNWDFFDSLATFVRSTRSHIATLNYDRLIYSHFIDSGILSGYGGTLVDGILNSGFAQENLERRWNRDFGYYLHLHGSPLFMEHLETIYKLQRHELNLNMDRFGSHIVLTHVKYKSSVINSSPILSAYWNYLFKCLTEVSEILLFGYSGCDDHLNLIISNNATGKRIRIIEWAGNGNQQTRAWFWHQKLNTDVEIDHLENITSFRDW